MSDYTELKRLAEAAGSGEWGYDGSYVCPVRREGGTRYVETWRSIADCHQQENTKFIAAANPSVVLALIAENERLRKLPTCWSEVIEQSEANDQLLDKVMDLSSEVDLRRWQPMESCPAHKDVLFFREDAGVFTGQLTYCESFMSEKEVEESELDEETLYLEDVFSFGPDGAYRCDGDLVPTHWMPFPSEPAK